MFEGRREVVHRLVEVSSKREVGETIEGGEGRGERGDRIVEVCRQDEMGELGREEMHLEELTRVRRTLITCVENGIDGVLTYPRFTHVT